MHARGSGLSGASGRSELPKRLSVCILAYKDLGVNTRVARQAAALAAAGHRVTVVSFAEPDLDLDPALAQVKFATTGVPSAGRTLSKLMQLGPLLPDRAADLAMRHLASVGLMCGQSRCQVFANQAVRATLGERFDIVQAHFDKALIAADAVRSRCGGRLVFDAVELPFDRESLPQSVAQRALRLAEMRRERDVARTADRWLTVSGALADAIAQRFHVTAPLVLRNCRDPQRDVAARLRKDLGLADDAKLVLALNSIREGEGLEVVVEALRHLPSDIHFGILGPGSDGPVGKQLQRNAADSGVEARLHFPPLQAPSELIAYASGADLGIIPRRSVTANMSLSLPNRFFEMVAAGLPLVTSRISEVAALAAHYEIGLVFDESDPRAAAAAMAEALAPRRWAALKAGIPAAAGELSWQRERASYVALIESLGTAEEPLPAKA